jgi:hypothetical protein
MPTARELLEQADALMRRDRDALAAGDRALPSSTPVTLAPRSLTGPAVSPRTIQREPIAPSVARTSLPIHPTDSPAISAPEAPGFAPAATPAPSRDASVAVPMPMHEAASTPDADFPTLTDAVVDIVEPAEDAAAFAHDDTGDVPILTDAVEATDGAAVDDLTRGEPSIWDVAARGDTSVLGQPPDSVVVVPPLDRLPIAPPPGRDPLGLDQPAPGFVAPASALAPAQTVSSPETGPPPEAPMETAQEAERTGEPERAFETSTSSDRADEPVPGDGAELGGPMSMPPLHGDDRARAVADHVALAGFAPLRPQPGYEAPSALDRGDTDEPDASEAVTEAHALSPAPAPDSVVAAPVDVAEADRTLPAAVALSPGIAPPPVESGAAPVLDDARVAEAVDEIRMQVLQRIDIFTDTTLRAKLGEQLQPLVERASADLVAAINQHVGDLLRTYVAEALEQEIERWRDGQR